MIPVLLGYIGPETVCPLLSVLAAVGGAILVAGRSILRFVNRCWSVAVTGTRQKEAVQPRDAT